MVAQHEALLSLVLGVLRSWNAPLYHLVAEVRGMQGVPGDILSKAVEVEERNKQLLEGMEKIVGQVSSLVTLLWFLFFWGFFFINERDGLWEEE